MQTLFLRIIISFTILVVVLSGCSETLAPPEAPSIYPYLYEELVFSDKIELSSYPTVGSIQTEFKFNLVMKDSSLNISNVKYDFKSDQRYEAD